MTSTRFQLLGAGLLGLVFASNALAADVLTKVDHLGALATPSLSAYQTNFALVAPNSFSTSNGNALTGNDRFFENYAFSVAPSTLASLTSTLSFSDFFGISNLQARLYKGSVNDVILGQAGPALVVAWGQSFTAGQAMVTNALIAPTELAGGDYVLQIRGTVSGNLGGSYSGQIQLSPIPEPQTYALFAAGLLVIGTLMQRSRRNEG